MLGVQKWLALCDKDERDPFLDGNWDQAQDRDKNPEHLPTGLVRLQYHFITILSFYILLPSVR